MSELRTNRIVPRDGLPSGSSGGIIQVKMGTFTDRFSTDSATMVDTGLSVSITPTRADSKILVNVSLGSFANGTALKRAFMNIVRDSTNVIVGDADTGHEVTACVNTRASGYASGTQIPVSFMVLDSPSTTSAVTYKVQASRGTDSGTVYLNYPESDDSYGANTASTIVVMEVSG
tara:strand:+ start:1183 stop:1707 length:525 start_codon:yes stop_codon:yes gene_type:complete